MRRCFGLGSAILIYALLAMILSGLAEDADPVGTESLVSDAMAAAMNDRVNAAAENEMNVTSNDTVNRGNAIDSSAASIPAPFNSSAAENATAANVTADFEGSAAADNMAVQGIWSGSAGDDDIVLALNQSGGLISGLAKSEGGNPWNGVVAGTISGDAISLSIAAEENGYPVSRHISARASEGIMQGDLIQYSSGSRASRGLFAATLINPDISSYTSAAVDTDASTSEETATSAVPVSPAASEASASDQDNNSAFEQQDAAQRNGGFNDVLVLAKGINPNIMPPMAPI